MSQIQKVQIIPRRLIKDERGWFLKAITGMEESIPSYTGEVYLTMGRPGQVKGGHYHLKASEWFTIVSGKALCRLKDIDSGEIIEYSLCFEDAKTVFVPKGVAHSFINTGNEDFVLLAYTDKLYDPKDTIPYTL